MPQLGRNTYRKKKEITQDHRRAKAPDDLLRQSDEVAALNEILLKDEFTSYKKENETVATFEANLTQNKLVLLPSTDEELTVEYLPPIRFVVSLPQDYPSNSSPSFTISCNWLSIKKLDLLAQELVKLWEQNGGEILYVWFLFLKEQSLEFLKITDAYCLIEKCQLHLSQGNLNISEISNTIDNANAHLTHKKGYLMIQTYHQESIEKLYRTLTEYSNLKIKEIFDETKQECNVCFGSLKGSCCTRFNCGHVSCKECLRQICEINIAEGSVESLACPEQDCTTEIPVNLIRELVSEDVYKRFDKLLLNKALEKMPNITYCPRRDCQYPVCNQSENGLAVCPSCEYAFCVYCKKVYHGVADCVLVSEKKKQLIEAYQNSSGEEKLKLEKRYGKKLLMGLVSAAQTEAWTKENCQQCPHCDVNIEKNRGCNKIFCRKCRTHFCWLCLKILSPHSPYNHFYGPNTCQLMPNESNAEEMYFEEAEEEDDY